MIGSPQGSLRRLLGLIRRIEYANRYILTPDGIEFAVFYTELHSWLLRLVMPLTSCRHHLSWLMIAVGEERASLTFGVCGS